MDFPWFYHNRTTLDDSGDRFINCENPAFFGHNLVNRHSVYNERKEGVINSDYWPMFADIVHRLLKSSTTKIYRAALNLTWGNNTKDYTIPHTDHGFTHNNLIVYLNEFTNGYTYLLDDLLRIRETIIPKPRMAVKFPGMNHCVGFCNHNEIRLVLVVTYE